MTTPQIRKHIGRQELPPKIMNKTRSCIYDVLSETKWYSYYA